MVGFICCQTSVPYGTVELVNVKSEVFKFNGHRIKHYFDGPLDVEDEFDLNFHSKIN